MAISLPPTGDTPTRPFESPVRSYDDIKRLAAETGRRIPDLLALASQNDPFYVMPAQVKQGEWFAALWERFSFPPGVHLRRIHYVLASQPPENPVILVDGRPYENTEKCWQYLGAASKAARCIHLVKADSFKDARNPDAVLHRNYPPRPGLTIGFGYWNPMQWDLPAIDADLAADLDWDIPDVRVGGYDATAHDQPFHLELISEKSTMDDIIVPLCQRLGVNYAPATGFASITGAVSLLKRLQQADKPGVVLYVSDFDPAGSFMPPAVARQLEYWLPTFAPDLEILLVPVVLTKEQVQRYDLPPIPIKESDKRQDNFLERYGVKGATELDALEALRPGELAKIITEAVAPYRDAAADMAARVAYWQADNAAKARWKALSRAHEWRLELLKEQAADIVEAYRERLESLRDELAEELEPIGKQLEALRQAVKDDFNEFDFYFDLPDRYESPLALPEAFDGLFDSRRAYLEQLPFYKRGGTADDLEGAHS